MIHRSVNKAGGATGAAELASGLQNLRMGSGGSAAEQQDGSADVQPAEMPDDYPDDGPPHPSVHNLFMLVHSR